MVNATAARADILSRSAAGRHQHKMPQTEMKLERSIELPVPSTGQTAENSASSDEAHEIDYDQPKSAITTPLKMKAGEEGGSTGNKLKNENDEECNQESERVRCQTLVRPSPANGFFVFVIVLVVCLCAQKALWKSDSDKEELASKWPGDFTSVLCNASPAESIAGIDFCLFLNGSGVAQQHCPLLHPLFHSHHLDRRVEWDAIF